VSDVEHWVGVVLPRLLGLAVIVYSFMLVHRARNQFFGVIRGLVVLSFMSAVTLLWLYETAMSLTHGEEWSHHPIIGISFVVLISWLSVWIVGVTTIHREVFTTPAFKEMMAARPINPITVWGGAGLLVIVVAFATGPSTAEALSDHGWLLGIVLAYLLVSLSFDITMPVLARKRGELKRLAREERVSMALLASAWVGLPSVEFFFDLYLRSASDVNYDPFYSWMMLAMFVFLLKSVMSPRFSSLVVDAEVEMTERGGFRSYDIPRGVYLFEDETSAPATRLFVELVTLPLRPDVNIPEGESAATDTLAFLIPKGLMVTRVFPERIRQEYPLQVTPIIWLTESPGERRMQPTSVALLTDTLMRFMEGNPNSIVMVDGIEYLMTFYECNKILKSLDSLNETAWITRSRLIISVDPKAFDAKQVAMLERDRIVVRGEAGIGELKLASQKLAASG
jgi:hypothetical protein